MATESVQLIRLPRTTGVQITAVLCESFYDYPVMRYVLGESADYDRDLTRMIGLFVTARVLLDDIVFGIMQGADLIAVATTSNPAIPPHADFEAQRKEVWTALGPAAADRYQRCVAAWQSMESNVPQLHVNMLGVRRAHQRSGHARRLLDAVHTAADQSGYATGVSLTTEDPGNVPFYRHLGYEVIGNTIIAPGVEAWSFFRRCAP